jgi:hypothetical protein
MRKVDTRAVLCCRSLKKLRSPALFAAGSCLSRFRVPPFAFLNSVQLESIAKDLVWRPLKGAAVNGRADNARAEIGVNQPDTTNRTVEAAVDG